MKRFVILTFALMLGGCSALTKQETTASNIPSAETLKASCAAGAAQVPPIRAGACDDYNTIATGCMALAAQPMIAPGSLLPCQAGGYPLSGGFTRL
jgi:hypothetical protein